MALLNTEVWDMGFVRDTTTRSIVTTTNTAGATWQEGFLRDPDGRLVVVNG